jgi:hypothetical protein
MLALRLARRLRPSRLGRKSSRAAAARTARAAASLTGADALSTRDTVAGDTRAWRATSVIVARARRTRGRDMRKMKTFSWQGW